MQHVCSACKCCDSDTILSLDSADLLAHPRTGEEVKQRESERSPGADSETASGSLSLQAVVPLIKHYFNMIYMI